MKAFLILRLQHVTVKNFTKYDLAASSRLTRKPVLFAFFYLSLGVIFTKNKSMFDRFVNMPPDGRIAR